MSGIGSQRHSGETMRRREVESCLALAAQMMCLPWTTFACTVGALLCLMQNAKTLADAEAGQGDGKTGGEEDRPAEPKRSNQDLGGDELKYVSYSILFTKRDYEVVVQERSEELLNYSTDGGSFAALKIAEFFGRVAAKQVTRPPLWVELSYPSEADCAGLNDWQLPRGDRRYVRFIYRVEVRLPKSETEYEKRETRALESIAHTL